MQHAARINLHWPMVIKTNQAKENYTNLTKGDPFFYE